MAPTSFTGTLTAVQAAAAMAQGWRHGAPHDTITTVPLSDGGPGFLDVLVDPLGAQEVAVTVSDPLGRPVPAVILLTEIDGLRTAVIESSQAAGLHLLTAAERDPVVTSSFGVGELLEAALAEGAERIIVGLGGAGTNDGGAGMLAALGLGSGAPVLAAGGGGLSELTQEAVTDLPDLVDRFARVRVVAATDTTAPLLGLHGTSAALSGARGASPADAQLLERALGAFVDVVDRVLPAPTDLVTGRPVRRERRPGAGAGGGLAYGLALLGAELTGAAELVLAFTQLAARASEVDLVVTGEGTFDWDSLSDSVVAAVARSCLEVGTASIVLAGRAYVGRRESMALGLSGVYAIVEDPHDLDAALLDPLGPLQARAERLARTWSPAR